MKNVKFRAWDVIKKEMRTCGDDRLYGSVTNIYLFTRFSDCLMQFTGLLDKNGKEIYEGDVVKLGYKEPFQALEIRWVRDHYEFCKGDLELLPVQAPSTDQMEVIGNIHENPELI